MPSPQVPSPPVCMTRYQLSVELNYAVKFDEINLMKDLI